MNTMIVCAENDKLQNIIELYDFLIKNQNKGIRLRCIPEAPCLETIGLYKILDQFEFESVEVWTSNLLESHSKYKIILKNPWHFFERAIQPVDSSLHVWNGNKTFSCLYGRPSANRLGILSYMNANHSDVSQLSCQGTVATDDSRSLFELEKLFSYRAQSIVDFSKLVNKLPMTIANSGQYSSTVPMEATDILIEPYQNILIDIVSETFIKGKMFNPTEKTSRPMLLKKPFIVMGSQNYLDYLHQMGFKTFGDFWSENYDGYESKERYIRILELIDNLASKSKTELEQMYLDMQYNLDYNYNLLISREFNTKITYIR